MPSPHVHIRRLSSFRSRPRRPLSSSESPTDLDFPSLPVAFAPLLSHLALSAPPSLYLSFHRPPLPPPIFPLSHPTFESENTVVEEALRAARRVNDYSTAVRIYEGLKEKTENAAQYKQYVDETKAVREELGVLLKEELYGSK